MVQALYYQIKCGRGSTAIAQGKAHATKVLNAGGTIAEARAVMLANAERKGVPLTGKDGRKAMESAFETQVDIGKARLERDRAMREVTAIEKRMIKNPRTADDFLKNSRLQGELDVAKRAVDSANRKLDGLKGEQRAKTQTSGAIGRGVSVTEAKRPLSEGETMRMKSYIGLRTLAEKQEAQALADKINKASGSSLTATDAAVIRRYTNSSYYVSANSSLRGEMSNKDLGTQQAQLAYSRQLYQAIDKLPKYKGEVTRVTPVPNSQLSRYDVGKTITWNGFSSTSKDTVSAYGDTSGKQKLQTFTNRSGDTYQGISLTKNHAVANWRQDHYREHGFTPPSTTDVTPITFKINSKTGRDISSIGRDGDNEVLLPHGFKGRVTRREGNTVYIDEI